MKDHAACIGPECHRPIFRGSYCAGHTKQLQRGGRLRPLKEKLPALERVIVAGSVFLEADTDEEYERALAAFRQAAEAWLRERGWSPPATAPMHPLPESLAAAPRCDT
jgi:hypothetical protein